MRNYFKYPGSESLPPLDDLLYNQSLFLIDNHISVTFPRPYLPNVVDFGGLSVRQAMPLPKVKNYCILRLFLRCGGGLL